MKFHQHTLRIYSLFGACVERLRGFYIQNQEEERPCSWSKRANPKLGLYLQCFASRNTQGLQRGSGSAEAAGLTPTCRAW